ncbi:hypothetical protein [Altererythrobacter aquiaggeris]|uniref:hypothetical protein n=1 Tax=Aestuarierythrobacter aquiaggeris TaxID=1898396 RepID=UPI00301B0B33
MTVMFAPARTASASPVARILTRPELGCPANDDRDHKSGKRPGDVALEAALRHFANHGLNAASTARASAQSAFFAGDRKQYDWWLEICRTIDRRMASEVAKLGEAQKAAD